MNEKEMIEEMAKIMAGCNTTCDECFEQLESIMTTKIEDKAQHCQAYMFAKRAIEAGYRKPLEGSVILTKDFMKHFDNNCIHIVDKIHKYGVKTYFSMDRINELNVKLDNTCKEIEEMASDMNYGCIKHDLYPDDAKEIAKALVILGYRNCKDKVVLSKEEFDEDYVTKQDRDYWKNKAEILGNKLKQAHKETAKEFADIVYKALTDQQIWKAKQNWWLQNNECFELKDLLKQILKQYGVEVEE